ncbi:hypothetical protein HD554DRAFT_2176857 [Boletus coccyginus]|nr:hypothetical protein HD554DRAFT_2176857 [Boletus coccyginus]
MEAMINRLLDERGIAKQDNSPTPTRRRASKQKDREVDDEKNDQHRSKHLACVRDLFKNAYGIEHDDDFGTYPSVTVEQVKAFERGGTGPDDEHPKWDMMGTKGSPWNDAVVDILAERLLGNFRQQSPQFPPKSRKYWEDAIKEKFTRIKAVWMRAQPRMTDTGQIENSDEVEEHRIEQDEKRLK